jgi:hypothetical protein
MSEASIQQVKKWIAKAESDLDPKPTGRQGLNPAYLVII